MSDTRLDHARDVLRLEADAVRAQIDQLGAPFLAACDLLLATRGHIIVTGLGKSGHIGEKIAATLASTGTPAFFVHAAEAGHGDLGMITGDDTILAISYSGESQEILMMLPIVRALGVKTIAITGRPQSALAQQADLHLPIIIEKEACPLGLAPTTSTTATLALGDALAITLMQARQFNEQDFARSHPYGRLGRRLMTKVGDVMRRDAAVPQVALDASVQTALFQITDKGLGVTLVSDGERLLGIFTDGDLRRALEKYPDALQRPIADVMTRAPQSTAPAVLAAEALQQMEARHITALPVLDDGRIAGIIHIHDLLRAGVA
ncbi:KpsF/GutQ family sugar-phosphate isomerase [uncultured Cardiobacterium sp.]|uniref:KpsF/GutQ family sugar-phosphate isomerase n=1 Tax=uncultured Cardiobacterium sp. TaxID=417619 RepID=UPI00262150D8|nr:KpsF/GutQ family sugar-phosphate isomerase [uncultured Cardiobacterium sp.]